jgi:hypothetical protein
MVISNRSNLDEMLYKNVLQPWLLKVSEKASQLLSVTALEVFLDGQHCCVLEGLDPRTERSAICILKQ